MTTRRQVCKIVYANQLLPDKIVINVNFNLRYLNGSHFPKSISVNGIDTFSVPGGGV